MTTDRRDEGICPSCGEKSLDRVEVDIGVGTQCGPWECFNCGWGEHNETPELKTLNDDPCPDCGTQLVAQPRGGVNCPACPYWFCY